MAIFYRKIKLLNTKKTLSIVLLAGIAAFSLSFIPAAALGPEFNIFPISYTGQQNNDLVLLDGRNSSRGESWSASQADHDAGVNAAPGEEVELSVYFHNGAPNASENTAINAIVRAFANPTLGTPALTHTISATIGAQNAATVSSASKGGNVNVNITGGTAQSLSLVPGSVKLYKDQGLSPKPGAQTMPDTIFTSGVNIGNVQGCFEFHGFVNFKVKVGQQLPPPPPQFSIALQKTVRNFTDNTGFVERVNADPGEVVEFKIVGTNTSNANISQFEFTDTLPNRLTLVANSVSINHTSAGSLMSGGLVTTASQIVPNESVTITFRATVADDSQFSAGVTELVNTAFLRTSGNVNLGPISDTAVVVVSKQQAIFDISIDKTVRNNSAAPNFLEQADAQPSDRATFKLVVTSGNSNQALQNVILRDVLPNKLTYVSGTLNVDGTLRSEGGLFTGSGFNLGTLNPGQQMVVTFQADVASTSNFNVGACEILSNYASVTSGTFTDSDTASVSVCKQAPVKQPGTPTPRPL